MSGKARSALEASALKKNTNVRAQVQSRQWEKRERCVTPARTQEVTTCSAAKRESFGQDALSRDFFWRRARDELAKTWP